MPTLKFGLHDFLNAQPLRLPLLRQEKMLGVKIVTDVPARLAEKLLAGELDLAMIPAIEFLLHLDRYRLLPGVCIASRGEVKTVFLVAKVPLKNIQTLAVDPRSRTSVALLKLLFADQFSSTIQFLSASPMPSKMLQDHDAALIIGDQAMGAQLLDGVKIAFDLSEEWFQRTGETFVHAVVVAQKNIELQSQLLDHLIQAGTKASDEVNAIVKDQGEKLGLEENVCRDYLLNKIIYSLGEQEMQGLKIFQEMCYAKGLVNTLGPFV
jgi:chorismate dehydratase